MIEPVLTDSKAQKKEKEKSSFYKNPALFKDIVMTNG
tara:strand:+ start:14114 stop:14224 length:111 start_codon:yes stop_codon:yes gene_type:complete